MELTPYEKNFSQKESQLFTFIVNHQEEVTKMTIRQLSALNQISTTSIIRFCRKFDCEGFSEFKIKLKNALHQDETLERPMSNTTKAMRYFFERMEEKSYQKTIRDTAEKIVESEIVYVLGDKESDIAVAYALKKLNVLDKMIMPIQQDTKLLKPIFKKNDRPSSLLVFSDSGQDKRIESILLSCKETSITTIAITNKATSNIASLADLSLTYYYTDGKQSQQALSQMPLIYIIELIYGYLVVR